MLTLIAAISSNNCIGKNGELPWHIPEDLAHFKSLTNGHTVLMGRKTWESIPEKYRPLPGRKNIVISRSTAYEVPPGVEVFDSIEHALEAHSDDDVYIIGGASMYEATIGIADALEITHVDREVDGDTFFPDIDMSVWHEVSRKGHDGFSFVRYEKVQRS